METCPVCGEELYFPAIELFGRTMTMKRSCKCIRDKEEKEERERKEREERIERAKNRSYCFNEYEDYKNCTFETDDMQEPTLSKKMKNYASNFDKFLENGNGLIFYGNVGAGKTFYSACIANELVNNGYKVMFTNFVNIIQRIQNETYNGMSVMKELEKCDLLIIDDLGVERGTEFMQEHVYNIIDMRYRKRKPIIVSTNLTGAELQNPQGVMASRIYGRILERCLPIRFDGADRRKKNTCYKDMIDILSR